MILAASISSALLIFSFYKVSLGNMPSFHISHPEKS
jgi:hypothetical protein